MGLAEVLADSRAKASSSEIERLISKCPVVPINDETDILTRKEAPDLGAMVRPFCRFWKKKMDPKIDYRPVEVNKPLQLWSIMQ